MSIFGGIAAGIGSLASGILNYKSVQDTNRQNLSLQRQQWQREDTAVQRRKADLIAAGMNPALAADGVGASSSSPVTMQAPQHPDYGAAVQNYMNIIQQQKTIEGIEKENQLKDEQSQMNAQQMLSIAEDIKKKRADLDEHLYNLSKYKAMGFPTNAGGAAQGILTIKGFLESPEFEKLKNSEAGQKIMQAAQAVIDGKGFPNNSANNWFNAQLEEANREALEIQEKRGAVKAREEAYENRKALEKYKKSGQAEIDRERKERLQRIYWSKKNPWD